MLLVAEIRPHPTVPGENQDFTLEGKVFVALENVREAYSTPEEFKNADEYIEVFHKAHEELAKYDATVAEGYLNAFDKVIEGTRNLLVRNTDVARSHNLM